MSNISNDNQDNINEIDFNFLDESILRLIEILSVENELLASFNISEITKTKEEKSQIISYLANARNLLSKNNYKDDLNLNTDLIKENLKLLDEMLIKNSDLVLRAMQVNDELIQIVNKVINDNLLNEKIYDDQGKYLRNNKKYNKSEPRSLIESV